MKKLLTCVLIAVLFITASFAAVRVKGYYRKNGTYVQPHYRTAPNHTVRDNYSYKGNYNPYTGKTGTNYYRNDSSSEYYNGYYNNRSAANCYYKIEIDSALKPPTEKKVSGYKSINSIKLKNW